MASTGGPLRRLLNRIAAENERHNDNQRHNDDERHHSDGRENGDGRGRGDGHPAEGRAAARRPPGGPPTPLVARPAPKGSPPRGRRNPGTAAATPVTPPAAAPAGASPPATTAGTVPATAPGSAAAAGTATTGTRPGGAPAPAAPPADPAAAPPSPAPPEHRAAPSEHGVRFSVRPAHPVAEDPPAPPPSPSPTTRPAPRWRLAARFPHAHRALGAVGALHRADGGDWACHAEPGGPAVWLLAALTPSLGAELAVLHGGEPWRLLPDGALAPPPGPPHSPAPGLPRHRAPQGAPARLADVAAWPRLDAVGLLARGPLGPPVRTGQPALRVLTARQLLGSVLRQAAAWGVEVGVQAVRASPLAQSPEAGAAETLLLELSAPEAVPYALVVALAALPRTAVCRPVRDCERLLLDVRLHPPADEEVLYSPVPERELWLVGDQLDWPVLRLEPLGRPSPAPAELVGVAPEPPAPAVPHRLPDTARAPAPPVRVVPDPHGAGEIDAVLLHDDELPLLRRWLPGRALGEVAFLLPGPGRHLLIEPVGLARELPFGVPLRRVGPGALFLECGHRLDPPLPPSARARLFAPDDASAVVCRPDGRDRFALTPMVPAWTLWAPPHPVEVPAGLSAAGRDLLAALEQVVGPARAADAAGAAAREDPGAALERAARLRALGDKEGAAEAFRAAGDLLEAARLFEEAALALPEDA